MVFLSPWILSALAALPVLWWVLRAIPPRAQNIPFPAFFLLEGIQPKSNTSSHTPFWLLLLRMLIVLLFILAFANPVMNPVEALPVKGKGNILLVVDTQWSAAHQWSVRKKKIQEVLNRADRADMGVVVVPTAPSALDGSVQAYGVMSTEDARGFVNALTPQPWKADYTKVSDVVSEVLREKNVAYTSFFSSGAWVPNGFLSEFDSVVHDEQTNNPYVLRQKAGFTFEVERWHEAEGKVLLYAYASDGALVDKLEVRFPSGKNKHEVTWEMLPEVQKKVSQVQVYASGTAAARVFLEAKSDRYHVGIISQHEYKDQRDLLDEIYYLKKALEGSGSVSVAELSALMEESYSALLLPDGTALTVEEEEALVNWVLSGGVLIRFAGPNLAANIENELLPVELRYGQRAMSGSMTWGKPLHIADIADTSPLYGITVPEDVTVKQQVLAEPSPEVFEKTWLRLEDGTPLVTGTKLGKGSMVLVHTTADPRWSDVCYSGLYVEMLERMASLGQGVVAYKGSDVLAPMMVMDGFGNLQSPDGGRSIIKSIVPEEVFVASPETPPGIYGDQGSFKIFNLGEVLTLTRKLTLPAGAMSENYVAENELRLKPLLLKLALILLFFDTVVALWMRRTLVVAMCFALVLMPQVAMAQIDKVANFVNNVNFAYVKTGDAQSDEISRNGLAGLAQIVSTRTSIKVKGVASVDLEDSDLLYFPFIYWPMTETQPFLSFEAAQNLQNYMEHGGVVVIDTRDRQFGDNAGEASIGIRKMRELTRNVQISELTLIPDNHLLGRSFYLLNEFPGRYAGGEIWVEKEPDIHHDGITSIIIGPHDWAAAWSKDPRDQARYIVEPDGEFQRERAYRFGVNLVMMALTGSYKADQIHVPHILERIGQ